MAQCVCQCIYLCTGFGSVTLGTWGEVEHWATVSPDRVCHLLISCHGELVRPSLSEVCPRGPAALPRWACGGFVCRGLVCVRVSRVHCVHDLGSSHSCFLHPHPSSLWPPVVLFLALKELLHHSYVCPLSAYLPYLKLINVYANTSSHEDCNNGDCKQIVQTYWAVKSPLIALGFAHSYDPLSSLFLYCQEVAGAGAGVRWMVRAQWCQRSICSGWWLHWQPSRGHCPRWFSHLSRLIMIFRSSGRIGVFVFPLTNMVALSFIHHTALTVFQFQSFWIAFCSGHPKIFETNRHPRFRPGIRSYQP